MLDNTGKVLYVGKAKNLQKRVASYFSGKKDPKTAHLLTQVYDIQITITRSEIEALILEYQLINQLKPRYNIIFRDDKSYPYIHLSSNEDFPRLSFYRGNTSGSGDFYGPFPTKTAVRESLELLKRTFQLRQCEMSYFKSRTRPCLQYQIKRCTAPCVGFIDKANYQRDVHNVQLFLSGKADKVIQDLIQKMDKASEQQEYELAARLRDQVVAMRAIQKQQIISDPADNKNLDILGLAQVRNNICIHILSIRDGRMLGSRQYFPTGALSLNNEEDAILENFILQHYLHLPKGDLLPAEIICPIKLSNSDLINEALKQKHQKNIKIVSASRGIKSEWLLMARNSAQVSLNMHLAADTQTEQQFFELSKALNSADGISRIECFDVSHTQGQSTMASCVVFDQSGPVKSAYRRFKIKTAAAGDDYAAMAEALRRHFISLQEKGGEFPDLLLIDGGKGQLSRAEQVCQELALTGVKILGIAKGPSRKPGKEKLFLAPQAQEIFLKPDSPALHILQRVRDEAHRFAITGHRSQRSKRGLHSVLEDIPGVGAARRRELLRQFGGLQEVKSATVEELAAVPGISAVLAKRIYDVLNQK